MTIDAVRGHLGELAALSAKTEAAERRILGVALKRLDAIDEEVPPARRAALAGGSAERERYVQMILERGQIQQVIARARAVL